MAETAWSLLEWVMNLAQDPAARAQLAADPQAVLAAHGFDGLATADLQFAMSLVAETLAADLPGDGEGAVLPDPDPLPGETAAEVAARQITFMTEHLGTPTDLGETDLDDVPPEGAGVDPSSTLDDPAAVDGDLLLDEHTGFGEHGPQVSGDDEFFGDGAGLRPSKETIAMSTDPGHDPRVTTAEHLGGPGSAPWNFDPATGEPLEYGDFGDPYSPIQHSMAPEAQPGVASYDPYTGKPLDEHGHVIEGLQNPWSGHEFQTSMEDRVAVDESGHLSPDEVRELEQRASEAGFDNVGEHGLAQSMAALRQEALNNGFPSVQEYVSAWETTGFNTGVAGPQPGHGPYGQFLLVQQQAAHAGYDNVRDYLDTQAVHPEATYNPETGNWEWTDPETGQTMTTLIGRVDEESGLNLDTDSVDASAQREALLNDPNLQQLAEASGFESVRAFLDSNHVNMEATPEEAAARYRWLELDAQEAGYDSVDDYINREGGGITGGILDGSDGAFEPDSPSFPPAGGGFDEHPGDSVGIESESDVLIGDDPRDSVGTTGTLSEAGTARGFGEGGEGEQYIGDFGAGEQPMTEDAGEYTTLEYRVPEGEGSVIGEQQGSEYRTLEYAYPGGEEPGGADSRDSYSSDSLSGSGSSSESSSSELVD